MKFAHFHLSFKQQITSWMVDMPFNPMLFNQPKIKIYFQQKIHLCFGKFANTHRLQRLSMLMQRIKQNCTFIPLLTYDSIHVDRCVFLLSFSFSFEIRLIEMITDSQKVIWISYLPDWPFQLIFIREKSYILAYNLITISIIPRKKQLI